MKKKNLLVVIVCLLTALLLFGCAGEITAMTAKEENVYLAIGNRLDLESCLEIEGKGKIEYIVETPEILSLDGHYVIGLKEGEGRVSAVSGSIICRIAITVYDGTTIVAGISDAEYDYDGEVKNLTITGYIPDGATATLFCNGVAFNGASKPGVYTVTLEITPPENFTVRYTKQTAVLTIRKLKADLSGLRFENRTFTYDGTEKSIVLEGDLPDYLKVEYENNVAAAAGVYRARAKFVYNEDLYETIYPMTAVLTIERATFNVDYGTFATSSIGYDGKRHIPSLGTLPAGLSARIFVYDSSYADTNKYPDRYVLLEEYVSSGARRFIDAGAYRMRAEFYAEGIYAENYIIPASRSITFTVSRAQAPMDIKWVKRGDFVYTGQPFTVGTEEGSFLRLTGDPPTGFDGEFAGLITMSAILDDGSTNEAVNVGTYTAHVVFDYATDKAQSDWEKNYLPLSDVPYKFTIERKQYEAVYSFGSDEADFAYKRDFDGVAHNFGLIFPTEGDENAFYEDITVKYYVNGSEEESISVIDAGNYRLSYRLSFKDPVYRDNYLLPDPTGDREINLVIDPYIINIIDTKIAPTEENPAAPKFSESVIAGKTTYTAAYTGEKFEFHVENIPEPVTVGGYELAVSAKVEYLTAKEEKAEEILSAGAYIVKASLFCVGIVEHNYRFKSLYSDNTETLTCEVVINKAEYSIDEANAVIKTISAEPRDGKFTYDRDKTLADYLLKCDEAANERFVKWEYPAVVPSCDVTFYGAIYNADRDNRLDYAFTVKLTIEKAKLDASLLQFSSQFLPEGNVSPKMTYDGEESDLFSADIVCEHGEDCPFEMGKHNIVSAEAVLVDEVNYEFVNGSTTFENVVVYVHDGNKFEYSGLQLVKCKDKGEEIVVPDGTASIRLGAFGNCTAMRKLTLPNSITSLSRSLLASAYSLEELILPFTGAESEGSGAVTEIFGGTLTVNLKKITVTDRNYVPDNAFKNCGNLEEIKYVLPVESVGSYAFDGCAKLKKVNFDSEYDGADLTGIATLGEGAFHGCFAVEKLKLPFIGERAGEMTGFSHIIGTDADQNAYVNYALAVLDLSECDFTTVPANRFSNLMIKELILPDSVREVADGGFSGIFAELKRADGSDFVAEKLSEGIFRNYRGQKVNFRDDITEIGANAFYNATAIESIVIPAGVTAIGANAFYKVTAEVTFAGNGISEIGERAFAGYGGSKITLPDSVTTIGREAFRDGSMTSATVGKNVENINGSAFYGCSSLLRAEISAKNISDRAFSSCVKLYELTLSGVEKIGEYAFYNCPAIREINFPETVSELGDGAFGAPGDYELNRVVFNGTVPPKVYAGTFKNGGKGILFYAPQGYTEIYNEAFRAVMAPEISFRAINR